MTDDQEMTRREALRLAGVAGVTFVALPKWLDAAINTETTRTAASNLKLTPELTEALTG